MSDVADEERNVGMRSRSSALTLRARPETTDRPGERQRRLALRPETLPPHTKINKDTPREDGKEGQRRVGLLGQAEV